MIGQHPLWQWLGFIALVLLLLTLDLGLFHRRQRVIPVREALLMTAGYVTIALLFNAWVYSRFGQEKALEFLAGYFIEYALSMDNVLVFVVILAYFQVPQQFQMRVLLWGILGALVLRLTFILAGFALITLFEWALLLLGAFLIVTGIRALASEEGPKDLEQSWVIRHTRRFVPMTPDYHEERFFVRTAAGLKATPLLLVLVVLNVTDIIFAVDSIPAVFAITRDPFIVYTSNVFAVLGLRALYFAISGLLDRFRYLKTGLSFVLIFIGFKMIFNYPENLPDIPTLWALIVTAALIFGSIGLSILRPEKNEPAEARPFER